MARTTRRIGSTTRVDKYANKAAVAQRERVALNKRFAQNDPDRQRRRAASTSAPADACTCGLPAWECEMLSQSGTNYGHR